MKQNDQDLDNWFILFHLLLSHDTQYHLNVFLNCYLEWNGLLENSVLENLNLIFAEKAFADIWYKLSIEPFNSSLNFSELQKVYSSFTEFVKMVLLNNIALACLSNFSLYSKDEFLRFCGIFLLAEAKHIQINHLFPKISDFDLAKQLLTVGGYQYVNQQIMSFYPEVNGLPSLSKDNFKKEVLNKAYSIQEIKGYLQIYIAKYNLAIYPKLDFVIPLLDNAHKRGKLSENCYLVIFKFILAAVDVYTEQQLEGFVMQAIKLVVAGNIEIFLAFDDELINVDQLSKLEDMMRTVIYLQKQNIPFVFDLSLTSSQLKGKLDDIQKNAVKKLVKERSIKEILSEFSSSNPQLEYTLNASQIDTIGKQLIQVKAFEKNIDGFSDAQLLALIQKIKSKLASGLLDQKEKNKYICELIAIANLAYIHHFNIYPHNVQILAVLSLLLPKTRNENQIYKGSLAQIRTGEGKSTIISMLALILACEGKCVDIITTTPYLAKRDELKFKQFYHYFGIETSSICNTNFSSNNFKGQIIYGPNYNFEFAILFDRLYLQGNRILYNDKHKVRPYDAVIIDEVDNMLIDKALNSARISFPSKQNFLDIYPLIYDYVKNNCKSKIFTKQEINKCLNLVKKFNILEAKLEKLMNSAYRACFELKIKTHYEIRKNKEQMSNSKDSPWQIVIIDEETGRLSEGSRWQYGLHQFLEYKHGLAIKDDAWTIGSLSHPAFINKYDQIYGVTGTIGPKSIRDELEAIYNLTTYDVPTFKPRLLIKLDTIICTDKDNYEKELIAKTKVMLKNNRPCLIICRSIEASIYIYQLLQKALLDEIPNLHTQLLNDIQNEDEEYLVANAGNGKVLTVATNAAGRGTDFDPTPEAIENGGLHVVFAFYPSDPRIEDQGGGRAGRQGNPGSYQIIVPHDDPILLSAMSRKLPDMVILFAKLAGIPLQELSPSDEGGAMISVKELDDYREQISKQSSEVRQIASKRNLIENEIMEMFTSWYQAQASSSEINRFIVLEQWAKFYTSLEDWEEVDNNPNLQRNNLQSESELMVYRNRLTEKYHNFMQSLNYR